MYTKKQNMKSYNISEHQIISERRGNQSKLLEVRVTIKEKCESYNDVFIDRPPN